MTAANDPPSAGEAAAMVEMLFKASELAPLAKIDHVNCDAAFRSLGRFFAWLDADDPAEGDDGNAST